VAQNVREKNDKIKIHTILFHQMVSKHRVMLSASEGSECREENPVAQQTSTIIR
jgi:hypothetical protein